MAMKIVMLCFCSLTNLFTVLIYRAALGKQDRYAEGMLYGVHIPKEALESEPVRELRSRYARKWKRLQTGSVILSLLSGVPFLFLEITTALLIWILWIFLYIGLADHQIFARHRELYRLKVENGWLDERTRHTVYVDTSLSAEEPDKPMLRAQAVFLAILLLTGLWAGRSAGEAMRRCSGWALYGGLAAVGLCCLLFQILIDRRKRSVVSADSETNRKVARASGRIWSTALLVVGGTNLAAWLYLFWRVLSQKWIGSVDLWIACLLQLPQAAVVGIACIAASRRRSELLTGNDEPLDVDDDAYWKDGWYSNPSDNRLFVPNRLSSANLTLNMAKPAAKVWTAVSYGIVHGTVLMTAYFAVLFAKVGITAETDGETVRIHAPLYHSEFALSEVRSAELLDRLPEDEWMKVNGAATDDYAIGRFTGRENGDCRLYLWKTDAPVLRIETADEVLYLGGRDAEETRAWYAMVGGK